MKKIMILSLLIPNLVQANFCPQATPLMKQYESQKSWVKKEVSEPGISLKLKGFVDGDNNFFVEEDFARTEQNVKLTVDPLNGDNDAFKNFCSDYNNNGDLLTAFRMAKEGNKYHLNMRYLPKPDLFSNDPFLGMKTLRYKVSLEVTPDSLIGRLPRKKELQEQATLDIEAQLNEQTPVGAYNITLTNWDDLACDLVQGKAQLSIAREMYSEDTFISMEEIVKETDVRHLYGEWHSQLEEIRNQDKLMFTAGIVLESLRQQGKVGDINTDTALKMMDKIHNPGAKGLEWLADQELACLSDSLQNYDKEYTQYKYNVIFKVNKAQSLAQGE